MHMHMRWAKTLCTMGYTSKSQNTRSAHSQAKWVHSQHKLHWNAFESNREPKWAKEMHSNTNCTVHKGKHTETHSRWVIRPQSPNLLKSSCQPKSAIESTNALKSKENSHAAQNDSRIESKAKQSQMHCLQHKLHEDALDVFVDGLYVQIHREPKMTQSADLALWTTQTALICTEMHWNATQMQSQAKSMQSKAKCTQTAHRWVIRPNLPNPKYGQNECIPKENTPKWTHDALRCTNAPNGQTLDGVLDWVIHAQKLHKHIHAQEEMCQALVLV
jgi:hypothetical protein